ncbi:MAG: hypothetical protein KVP17_002281 [Porospora cf. gigantea B]|uniref:uncharacterized protein n=1 Tax=Porospora cf. gigantea B TaxID=2853592 RepID=UPI003571960B|nr:MAG: hypothetical protein KVP17_002281 [Porospora cf. gigantea B]
MLFRAEKIHNDEEAQTQELLASFVEEFGNVDAPTRSTAEREIDLFMDEIKQRHEKGDRRHRVLLLKSTSEVDARRVCEPFGRLEVVERESEEVVRVTFSNSQSAVSAFRHLVRLEPQIEANIEGCVGVVAPRDPDVQRLIDIVASHVADKGYRLEQLLMLEKRGEPCFDFLFHASDPLNRYYRWRVWSLLKGPTGALFQMQQGGPTWVAPIDDSASRTEIGPGGQTLQDVEAWRCRVRSLTLQCRSVADAMVFALDRWACASHVVTVLAEEVCATETPVEKRTAVLFLMSDLLYNCVRGPNPKAWVYRSELEAVLPTVFRSLYLYIKTRGRLETDSLRHAASQVLAAWLEFGLYSTGYIKGLEAVLLLDKRKAAALMELPRDPLPLPDNVDVDLLGDPLPEVLTQVPYWLRLKYLEWQEYDDAKLERLCRLQGLPLESRQELLGLGHSEREKHIRRLIFYETYQQLTH